MKKIRYQDWEKILLDTSILISYLQALRDNNKDVRCDFVKRLIDDLVKNKTTSGKNRLFYVSSITISELLNQNVDSKPKIMKIIEKFFQIRHEDC